MSLHPLPPSSWLPEAEAGLQDPAVFLQAEAAMAGEELVWEVNSRNGHCQNVPLSPPAMPLAKPIIPDLCPRPQVEESEEVPGLAPSSVKVQLTYFESSVTVEEETEALAVARAARETLQQTGPWLAEEELDQVGVGSHRGSWN